VQALSGSLLCWNAGSPASSSVQQLYQQDLLLLSPYQGFAAHYAKGKGEAATVTAAAQSIELGSSVLNQL
jgi:hypothetical protein